MDCLCDHDARWDDLMWCYCPKCHGPGGIAVIPVTREEAMLVAKNNAKIAHYYTGLYEGLLSKGAEDPERPADMVIVGPMARSDGPGTSHRAARKIQVKLGRHFYKILCVYAEYDRPLVDHEMHALGGFHAKMKYTARVHQLVENGLLAKVGERYWPGSDGKGRECVITEAGRKAIAAAEGRGELKVAGP